MSAIRDEEDLIVSIKDFFKANLNTRITAINVEKTDFDIATLTADDYHFVIAGQLVDLPNHIFCQIAIDDITLTINGDDLKSEVIVSIEIGFDNPKTANTYFTSLRYMRAVYETLSEYEASTPEVAGMQITNAMPMIITKNKRELVIVGAKGNIALG